MKTNAMVLCFLVAALISSPAFSVAQNLLSSSDPIELAALPLVGYAADDNAYADGTRSINSGHWSDAITIFSRIAAQGSTHADGALYWKAYAENKLGQSGTALETCGALRRDHPGSNWIEDCGALEIEIHAKNGQPVQPNAELSDDLKLLALASLMQHDEKSALKEIDEILNGGSSEKLKQGALFIMGEHHTDTVYPQIARVSYVEGDVRVERGGQEGHHKDVVWEQAVSDLPLEEGYSLVTGEGRAEIELENASTLYLAPNSVLTLNDLSTTAGVPHTELALLSGTVTLHVRPYISGETFLLRTPTDNLSTKYPEIANFRLSSYLDGIAIGALDSSMFGLRWTGQPHQLTPGQTLYFKDGQRIMDAGPVHLPDFTSWDQWVATRFSSRTAAASEMLQASGLSTPIPGLADLQGKGSFFDCAPYGTCWEPNAQPEEPAVSSRLASSPEKSELAAQSGSATSPAQTQPAGRDIKIIGRPAVSGVPSQSSALEDGFPCIPSEVRYQLGRSVIPGSTRGGLLPAQFHTNPWDWAVCHSGSWLYRRHHYVWVVGRRHHHPPVHWVKSGYTVAFVPIHPHDVKDRPPVNRMAAVFAVNKDTHTIERIELTSTHPLELLKEPPREFRTAVPTPLPHAAEPHMEGHQIRDTIAAKGEPLRPAGIPITFDHKSQSFMMQQSHSIQGGRTVTGFAPISNHSGDLQSHSGAFNGGAGFHSGYSGSGGYHGGASGGSFHGGGGVSSGGASHGGGGGGGSSSASSGGGSGSSGASGGGGGGSHH